jgi:rubrerythrin
MAFPGPGAHIYRNEAGEPIGWDYPSEDAGAYYCDLCGYTHAGDCPDDEDDDA